ncbi:MAG: sulfatase-like hydrolase/transferase [Mycoplasmatales bacterium]|nr:sulfatase-like hydrolase/transferase [Mycoplasmatales bacterium]
MKISKALKLTTTIGVTIALPTAVIIASVASIEKSEKMTHSKEDITNLMEFSQNKKNVIIYFTDSLSGNGISTFLSQNPKISNKLKGFTMYDNTVSPNYTNLGVPAIVGGWDFTLDEQKYGMYKNVNGQKVVNLAHENMMSMMEKAGYTQSWHTMQYYGSGGTTFSIDPSDAMSYIGKKRDINVTRPSWVNKAYEKNYKSDTPPQFKHMSALKEINQHLNLVKTKKPVFKFIGNESSHTPFSYEENGKYYKGQGDGNSKNKSLKTTMDLFGGFIDKVKSFGQEVYDNTMIMFVTDHGSHENDRASYKYLSPEMKKLESDFLGVKGLFKEFGNTSIIRNNPTILFKPFGSNNKLKFNRKNLMSIYDVPQLILNEINKGKTNPLNYNLNKSHNKMYSSNPLSLTNRTLEVYNESYWYIEPGSTHTIPNVALRVHNNFYDFNNWEWTHFKAKKQWKKIIR